MITDAILASQVHYIFSYRGLCLSSIRCESGLECSSTGGCCRGVFQWRPCASGVLAPVMCRWCSWACHLLFLVLHVLKSFLPFARLLGSTTDDVCCICLAA